RHYYRDPDAFAPVNDRDRGLIPIATEPSLPAICPDEPTSVVELTRTPSDPFDPRDPRESTDPHHTMTAVATSVASPGHASSSYTIVERNRADTDRDGATLAQRLGETEGEITRKVKLAISDAQQVLERENQRLRVALSLAAATGQIHR